MPIAYYRNSNTQGEWDNPDNWSDDIDGISDFDGGSGGIPWIGGAYNTYDILMATGYGVSPPALIEVGANGVCQLAPLTGQTCGEPGLDSFPALDVLSGSEISDGVYFLQSLQLGGVVNGGVFELLAQGEAYGTAMVNAGDWTTSPYGLQFSGSAGLFTSMAPLSNEVYFSGSASFEGVTHDVPHFYSETSRSVSASSNALATYTDSAYAESCAFGLEVIFAGASLADNCNLADSALAHYRDGAYALGGGCQGVANFHDDALVNGVSHTSPAVVRFFDNSVDAGQNNFDTGVRVEFHSATSAVATILATLPGSTYTDPPVLLFADAIRGSIA